MPAATSLSVVSANSLRKMGEMDSLDLPFPATALPPDIERPHSGVCQIERRTTHASHPMHHPTFAIPSTQLRSHIQETLDFTMHISIGDISPIFAPLARKDTLRRGIWWHRRDRWIADERESARLVEPCTAAAASGEELVLERSVDDANDWTMLHDEADRDAEHGEKVGVIDGSCNPS